ncbi:MAG: DedA family protein, partial [Bdellovibrionales bacterium]|nr:DedA family protein [Bdellovibrionales bacterium]
METLLNLIHNHVDIAHWIILAGLLAAGFFIPISEDAVLFVTAYLAATHPESMYKLFLFCFAGVYLSDLISFTIGWMLGGRLWNYKYLARITHKDRIETVSRFYQRFGFWTLIVGRFIPFGVRSALFLTAGIGKMSPARFAFADFIAAIISTSFFLYIYYTFGKPVVEYVKQGNIVLFSVFISLVISILTYKHL